MDSYQFQKDISESFFFLAFWSVSIVIILLVIPAVYPFLQTSQEDTVIVMDNFNIAEYGANIGPSNRRL